MIRKAVDGGWEGIPSSPYKTEPGRWKDVSRKTLFDSLTSDFQVRYFGVAPGGYTSYERHEHEHCVIVLTGAGRVKLGDDWHFIGPNDFVHVGPMIPHQFENTGATELGIICVVDKNRDRPEPLGAEEASQTSNN